ncbi:hypothetical protein ACIQPR_37025 [Streptomyces sp. NPDC091280]|uniref:hypothetical protein n=1 Tax=unclassified Streptomyces TaxID=2593676 RepID=UPI00381915F1
MTRIRKTVRAVVRGAGGAAGITDPADRPPAGPRKSAEGARTPSPGAPAPDRRALGRRRFPAAGEGCAAITIARAEIRQFIDA